MILFILYVNACENFFFRKIDGKCIFFQNYAKIC